MRLIHTAALLLAAAVALTACKTETKREATAEKEAPNPGARLVGSWGVEGVEMFEFNADGTGKMVGDEESFKWTADATDLKINPPDGMKMSMPYKLAGTHLSFDFGDEKMELDRMTPEPTPGKKVAHQK